MTRDQDPDAWGSASGAEVYAEAVRRGTLYPRLARRLAEWLVPAPGSRLLDLAAGTGLSSEPLLARVGPRGAVVALDRAQAMLTVAQREVPLGECGFVRADPAALPFLDQSFDGAISSAAFWHFPAPSRVFTELARVIKPIGRLAFNVPEHQLSDGDEPPPPPLFSVLYHEGLRRFGRPPEPAGPKRNRTEWLAQAAEAGWTLREERTSDLGFPQSELVDLLGVPAIGRRFYPDVRREETERFLQSAVAQVDPTQEVSVRWREFLLVKT